MPVRRIGVLGGAFDPVHCGHLRFAIEFLNVLTALNADSQVRLVPCRVPPHRAPPLATPIQRLEMLQLGIGERAGLHPDPRELESDATSFSIDTLNALHAEFPAAHLTLAVGMDAFAGFCRWHRWRDILELASLLVGTRPGAAEAHELLRERRVALSQLRAPGEIALLKVMPMDLSSSRIRATIAAGRCVDFLLPDAVACYIDTHKLYRR